MMTYVVELNDDNFETVFADNLKDAEEQAYNMFGFDYLEVHEAVEIEYIKSNL